jgi:bacterial/archaeal transporter family-2 protein
MNWTYAVLALLAGALLPLQALINARLGHATAGGLFASACSFLVGTIALALVLLATRPAVPSADALLRLPPWVWTGGLLGAAFVVVATLAVPRIGAAPLVALVVLGQMLAALLLDHFGVLQAARTVDASRVLGAVLVLVGVLLVLQPWKAR